MVPTRSAKPMVRPEASTSRVVDRDASSAVSRIATSMLGASLFLATEVVALGVDLAPMFWKAAALCERGSVIASSAEVHEGVAVERPLVEDVALSSGTTWHAAAARMDALPARPAIERASVTPGVCMVDNRTGVFCLVGPTGQVYTPDRVLLDSGAQPVMLGKAACLGLGIRKSMLEPCPFQIQTSLGGVSERSHFCTRDQISVQLRPDHATDSSTVGVSAVVTSAESYDVLVGGAVLYTMWFQMDYWTETTCYRPGWQSGEGRTCQIPVRFTPGVWGG